jgi:hypothetical protein
MLFFNQCLDFAIVHHNVHEVVFVELECHFLESAKSLATLLLH